MTWAQAPDVRLFVDSALLLAKQRSVWGWSAIEFGAFVMHDHDARPAASLLGCSRYVGIDWRAGPGVDLVALNEEAPALLGDKRFDLALSISALEHDPRWRETLAAMVAVLRPGGVAAVTVPSGGWPPHEVECAPLGGAHYRNLSVEEVLDGLVATGRVAQVIKAADDPSVLGRRRANVVVVCNEGQ